MIIKYISVILLFVSLFLSCKQTNKNNDLKENDTIGEDKQLLIDALSPFYPYTEINQDSTLNVFLNDLTNIVNQKDTNALAALMHENIIISYGGGYRNIDGFYSYLEDGGFTIEGGLWHSLNKAIQLGGYFQNNNEFIMPYCVRDSLKYFFDDEDEYYNNTPFIGCCTDSLVVLYSEPDIASDTICILKYNVYIYDWDATSNNNFTAIRIANTELKGYVENDKIYSNTFKHLILLNDSVKGWQIYIFAANI